MRAVAAALLLALPSAAAAECMMAGSFFSPEAGAIVPPDPVLFYFASPWAAEGTTFTAKDAEGKPLPVAATQVTKADAHVAFRVAVKASAGAVVVEARRGTGTPVEARYRVGAPGGCAAEKPVEIRSAKVESYAWTCSHQSTKNLVVSVEAPAYRVEWSRSEADFRAGKREKVVVPHRMERFFHWGEKPWAPPGPGQVELGHVNCMGHTLRWDAPAYWVGVAALHEDGTEDPPAGPVRVEAPPLAR